jgi:hypothetical protein
MESSEFCLLEQTKTCGEYFKIGHARKPKSTTITNHFDRSRQLCFTIIL